MSLAIDVDTVVRVLLADGWHDVEDASFGLDSYEYLWSGRSGVSVADLDRRQGDPEYRYDRNEPMILHGGGASGICACGFVFKTKDGTKLYGPLTAILAVEADEVNPPQYRDDD